MFLKNETSMEWYIISLDRMLDTMLYNFLGIKRRMYRNKWLSWNFLFNSIRYWFLSSVHMYLLVTSLLELSFYCAFYFVFFFFVRKISYSEVNSFFSFLYKISYCNCKIVNILILLIFFFFFFYIQFNTHRW